MPKNREKRKQTILNQDPRTRVPSDLRELVCDMVGPRSSEYQEGLKMYKNLVATHKAAGLDTPTNSEYESAMTIHNNMKQNVNYTNQW